MLLPFPEPYDFEVSSERFRVFGTDLANLWEDGALYRAISGREVRIAAAPGGVDVRPLDELTRPVVEKLLGLEFDLDPFTAWAAEQPVLAEIVARLPGFRPPLSPDAFESLVTSITSQQVSLRSAFAMRSRFVAKLGEPVGRVFAFPTRERVAAANEADLFSLGFSHRKAEYVIGLARDELDLDSLAEQGDDEIRARLVAVRGLGPWTAEWFLARHLARPRAWPLGDVALRRAVNLFYGSTVEEVGPRLDPFQNLSAHYLLTGSDAMNIRLATPQDEQALHELTDEFVAEIPEPEGWTGRPWETEWTALQAAIGIGAMFIAEDADGPAGMLEAQVAEPGRWHVDTVYVRERARREGVAKALLHACAGAARVAGATHISLGVLVTNTVAETVWRRLGFEPVELVMAQSLDLLDGRLGNAPAGPSHGSIHAKTDDRLSVDRAVAEVVPRLANPAVTDEPGGWIRISDELLDTDRDLQMTLASDISDRLGTAVVGLAVEHGAVVRFRLYERGLMLDEYLSVPTYYEALDLGDSLALHANPTLVARLTGADRDQVRQVAKTGDSPADLPPAETLYEEIAKLMGLTP